MCQAADDEREARRTTIARKSTREGCMTVTEPCDSRHRAARRRRAVRGANTRRIRRQKTIYDVLFWGGFVACVVAAGITAKFDVVTLLQGLPRTTEFLVKLVPPIELVDLRRTISREWYWDIGKWLDSLLNTLLMAYLATVLGTIIGGFLSFFAARNLAPHYADYWIDAPRRWRSRAPFRISCGRCCSSSRSASGRSPASWPSRCTPSARRESCSPR